MEIVTDMGRHAMYVWPAYAAFAAVFAALCWWVVGSNRRAKARLDAMERKEK